MASGIHNPGRRNTLAHLLTMAAAAAAPMARAQGARWPEKPVRIIVPFAPGGGTDQVHASFVTESWNGLLAPAGTPDAVVYRDSAQFAQFIQANRIRVD